MVQTCLQPLHFFLLFLVQMIKQTREGKAGPDTDHNQRVYRRVAHFWNLKVKHV